MIELKNLVIDEKYDLEEHYSSLILVQILSRKERVFGEESGSDCLLWQRTFVLSCGG